MEAKQLQCIELMVLNPYLTDEEIAEKCQITRQTIYNWKKTPEFQEEFNNKLDEAWKKLAYKAQNKMNKLLESSNDNVVLGATKYILDSYGRGAPTKIEHKIEPYVWEEV